MLLGVHTEESFKIMFVSTLNSNYLFILVDFLWNDFPTYIKTGLATRLMNKNKSQDLTEFWN